MKTLFFASAIFILTHSQVKSQVNQVINLMQEQETAWNQGDIESFMQHYWHNDSLQFIGKKGITYGWQKTYDNYKKSYPTKEAMGLLKFKILQANLLANDAIYVVGSWQLSKESPVGGHFTLLWRKIGGKWLIVSDHTS